MANDLMRLGARLPGGESFEPCVLCGEETTRTLPRTVCYACRKRAEAFAEERRALEASIPASYQWATLDAPELSKRALGGALTVRKARAVTLAPRLLIQGDSGAGKTSLAVAMAREWCIARRTGALFVSVPTLATARSRSPLGREAEEVLFAMRAPLLLLDDLGGERDLPTSPVTDVIRERHAAGQPLWVTTWLGVDGIVQRYGEGIARRLSERAVFLKVPE